MKVLETILTFIIAIVFMSMCYVSCDKGETASRERAMYKLKNECEELK